MLRPCISLRKPGILCPSTYTLEPRSRSRGKCRVPHIRAGCADEEKVGAWLQCLGLGGLLLGQLQGTRAASSSGVNPTVHSLLATLIGPAIQHANSTAVRCGKGYESLDPHKIYGSSRISINLGHVDVVLLHGNICVGLATGLELSAHRLISSIL